MATVFTQAGEELAADLFDGTAAAPANHYIHWGTGTNVAAKGNTALQTPGAEARVVAVRSQPAADVNRFVATITATSGKTVTEAGLFTASSAGIMPVRGDFTGVVLNTNDRIEFTIDIEWT